MRPVAVVALLIALSPLVTGVAGQPAERAAPTERAAPIEPAGPTEPAEPAGPGGTVGSVGPVAVSYRPPVAGTLKVLRGFDPPAAPFGPGHLGVDLALAQGAPVLAAAAGTVTFAGQVAGRGVVVVQHSDGIRTEYEPVVPSVRRGAVVAGGTVIGNLSGAHRGCPSTGCLHWGARRGGSYLDPLSLLAPLGPVRLLPWRSCCAP
jgi:murein DD-endopeptidase MepM/ murein hydrolase activator NlpD